jgi:hypothetical protein
MTSGNARRRAPGFVGIGALSWAREAPADGRVGARLAVLKTRLVDVQLLGLARHVSRARLSPPKPPRFLMRPLRSGGTLGGRVGDSRCSTFFVL